MPAERLPRPNPCSLLRRPVDGLERLRRNTRVSRLAVVALDAGFQRVTECRPELPGQVSGRGHHGGPDQAGERLPGKAAPSRGRQPRSTYGGGATGRLAAAGGCSAIGSDAICREKCESSFATSSGPALSTAAARGATGTACTRAAGASPSSACRRRCQTLPSARSQESSLRPVIAAGCTSRSLPKAAQPQRAR